jgi:hypothetical protein
MSKADLNQDQKFLMSVFFSAVVLMVALDFYDKYKQRNATTTSTN